MKNKKRILISGILLGLLSLGVINASFYWNSGETSKELFFSEVSDEMTEETVGLLAGEMNFFDESSDDAIAEYPSNSFIAPRGLLSKKSSEDVVDDQDEYESELPSSSFTSSAVGGGMTQQDGRLSSSMSAGTSSNHGSYRGGYARHSANNGVWNSLKPTASSGESDSGSKIEVNQGGPSSVPDGGVTIWMLGLSLLGISLLAKKYKVSTR